MNEMEIPESPHSTPPSPTPLSFQGRLNPLPHKFTPCLCAFHLGSGLVTGLWHGSPLAAIVPGTDSALAPALPHSNPVRLSRLLRFNQAPVAPGAGLFEVVGPAVADHAKVDGQIRTGPDAGEDLAIPVHAHRMDLNPGVHRGEDPQCFLRSDPVGLGQLWGVNAPEPDPHLDAVDHHLEGIPVNDSGYGPHEGGVGEIAEFLGSAVFQP